MNIEIRLLAEGATVPTYGSAGAAAFDLYSNENCVLESGQTRTVRTDIAMAIPEGYVGLIWDRSGLPRKDSIHRLAGVIDEDYRGGVGVVLHNLSEKNYAVKKGDKIAKMLIQKVERINFKVVEELSETVRGEKGFGSTGR